MNKRQGFLFAGIILLVGISALIGWVSNTLYATNAAELIIKLKYYDLSLLLVAIPIGLVTLILSVLNHQRARLFSIGWTVYILFSFVVTLFTCHQNSLFLVYVTIIALSSLYILQVYSEISHSFSGTLPKGTRILASITLLFSAGSGFIFLFSDAIHVLFQPSADMQVKVPQVLDMAYMLPLSIYGAIRIWRNKTSGIWISSMMMIFFVLIGISVVAMEFGLVLKAGLELDAGKVYSFAFISLLNLFVAIRSYRKLSIGKP